MVSAGQMDRGILVCGTGFGMCIAANKVKGIRAVSCRDPIEAEMSRRHNNANVLCMSADFLGQELIDRLVQVWLTTNFEEGRHQRRVDKIATYETGRN
jgi:ribose 5-phosphate isomerase B